MEMIKVTVNNKTVEVPKIATILAAAKTAGVNIPTLCYLDIHKHSTGKNASCRMCVVEIEGRRNLAPACATPVSPNMIIRTESEKITQSRRTILDLMLSDHKVECLVCEKASVCKLQDYCYEYGVKESSFKGIKNKYNIDESNEFYTKDLEKCINCRRCVNACNEYQCTDAISFAGRGFGTHVATAFDKGMKESVCVSCGNCVSVCPTGALAPKTKEKHRAWELKKVKTVCAYCGVGCSLDLLVKGNKVVGVEPLKGEANTGMLCVKGKFGFEFINHKDRLTKPLIRKEGVLVECEWEEAYNHIEEKYREIKGKNGSDVFAGLASARVSNEENYLFQKMIRAVFGNNNIDHCARLCHASTVAGLAVTLGSGAMTNSIDEVLHSEVIFVTGSNTTEAHPVIGAKIRQAKKNGAKIIVAEPRKIDLVNDAEIFLQIKPGTNVALFNGLMNVIIEENLQNEEFIKAQTENYDELVEIVKKYTPEICAEICNVRAEDIRNAARMYARAKTAAIYYSMGVTQHTTGVQGVMSISNLALLCGHIGRESCGVNPLRGQNNVQGACDVGALPGDFTGYQKVHNKESREKFENAWGVKLSEKPGLTVTEIIDKAYKNEIKFLYIMGENPIVSDPDTNHVREALKNIEFLVVQDIFLTETAEYADVVLPAASFAEKDGTYTNTERRVQLGRKAINPVGKSKADWVIIMELMAKLGYEKKYSHPSEIMDEIAGLTPQYGGISHERLEHRTLQWPCPDKKHNGTKFLHKDKFAIGKAKFKPNEYIPSNERPNNDYPFILTTGRLLFHYHTRTMTGRVEGIDKLFPESFIEINPEDALKLNIKNEENIKVISRRGEIVTKTVITERVPVGVVFVPFHFSEGSANVLTNPAVDPIAKIPELKVAAVRIEKIL